MPEPVVIIGPAQKPAGPIAAGPGENADLAAADDTGLPRQDSPQSDKGKLSMLLPALASMGTRLFGLVARGVLAIARWGMRVAGRYPRHSLAAAASVLILGAISYTQTSPGTGTRGLVPTQIKGDSSSGLAKDTKNAAGPKTNGSAATAGTETAGAAKPGGTTSAPSDASSLAGGSSPAATPNDGATPPLPSVAAAQPGAKETEPAPGKEAAPADLAAAGKREPGPSPASAPGQSTPTLLTGSLAEPAPTPSSPVANDDKGSGDALKPAPAVEAPAPVALIPSPGAQGEPAPAPAPTSDSVQLATKPEPAGDQKQSTATSVANPPDTQSKDALTPAETKTAREPQGAPQSDPARQPSPPIPSPESTKIESVQSEPPKSEAPKGQEPAPAAIGPAPGSEVPVVPPATLELPAPGGEAAAPAKSAAQGSAPALEASTPGAQNGVSQTAMPAPLPLAAAAALDGPKATLATTEGDPPSSAARHDRTPARSATKEDLASEGWVSVPNSGKLPIEGVQDADGGSASAGAIGEALAPATRDARAHAAKDASFELESHRSRETPDLEQNGGRAAAGAGAAVEARSRSTAGRVESVPHVVERNENFWTISRLYYSSGRYYRALWKANADTHPDIKKLKVNDVIVVPPVEDLDPAYIDPPKGRARARAQDDAALVAEPAVSSSVAARDPADGVPVRRSSRTDPDLDLPPPDAVFRRAPAPDRTGRRADRPLDDGDETREEPASRTAARPGASGRRPVYKIRQNDTLRAIARDMLGDSHRASEILDLNRDLIDDPSHLIVGQILELPDDARTSVRRSASR